MPYQYHSPNRQKDLIFRQQKLRIHILSSSLVLLSQHLKVLKTSSFSGIQLRIFVPSFFCKSFGSKCVKVLTNQSERRQTEAEQPNKPTRTNKAEQFEVDCKQESVLTHQLC